MAMVRKTGKSKRNSLFQQTERIVERKPRRHSLAEDALDTDIPSYVEAFVKGLPEAVKLEKISLATEEDAKQALAVVSETMQRLNEQIANARALQTLLNSSIGKA